MTTLNAPLLANHLLSLSSTACFAYTSASRRCFTTWQPVSFSPKSTAKAAPTLEQQLAPDLPPDLPTPKPFHIKSVSLLKSSSTLEQCPPAQLPEIAIVGRSNVGKSSLINMLTRVNKLAHVSKTPGKTQSLNHYTVNNTWHLVDFPGYGYARAAKQSRMQWLKACEDFCLYRPTLLNVLLLVDSSIPPKPLDLEAAQWFAEHGVPFSIVFTKADKKKPGTPGPPANITAFRSQLAELFDPKPPSLVTSSAVGYGREQLLSFVSQLLQLSRQAQPQSQSGGGQGAHAGVAGTGSQAV